MNHANNKIVWDKHFADVVVEFGKMKNAELYKYIGDTNRHPPNHPLWKNSTKKRMLEYLATERFITTVITETKHQTCETCETCDETVKLNEKSNSYWCENCAEQIPCPDCGCWYFEEDGEFCGNCIDNQEINGICFECGVEGKFIGREGDDWCCVDCSSI